MRHKPTNSWFLRNLFHLIPTEVCRNVGSYRFEHCKLLLQWMKMHHFGLWHLHQRDSLTTYTRCVKSMSISHLHQTSSHVCVVILDQSCSAFCTLLPTEEPLSTNEKWPLEVNTKYEFSSIKPTAHLIPVSSARPHSPGLPYKSEEEDLPGHTTPGWYRCTQATILLVHWSCCRLLWGLPWIGPLGWGLPAPH